MTVDVTLVAYAVPFLALAIVLVGMRSRRSGASRPPATRSPVPGIVVGVLGLAFGGTMFLMAQADQHAYATDSTCVAGFGATSEPGALCRLASTRIVRWYWSGGRHSRRHLVLARGGGLRDDVTYGRDVRGSVWRGIYDTADLIATVQYFKSDIVLVETRSGLATTDAEPSARVSLWAFVGIGAGFIGMMSALQAARLSLPLSGSASPFGNG